MGLPIVPVPIVSSQLPLSSREFASVLLSHGWYRLFPYQTDGKTFLRYAFNIEGRRGEFIVSSARNQTRLDTVTGTEKDSLDVARRVFALDWETARFYELLKPHHEFAWIRKGRHGRFLRSATLFEDVLKIILTTNTVWDRTQAMNDRAVELWGETISTVKAFPTPEAIIRAGETKLRNELGCGYRAPYIVQLAERALSEPEIFLGGATLTWNETQFLSLLSSVRGVGPVSANYVARMYGHSLGFAIDAYVLRRCRELWGADTKTVNQFLNERFGALKPFSALVLWLEITRHWHGQSQATRKVFPL